METTPASPHAEQLEAREHRTLAEQAHFDIRPRPYEYAVAAGAMIASLIILAANARDILAALLP